MERRILGCFFLLSVFHMPCAAHVEDTSESIRSELDKLSIQIVLETDTYEARMDGGSFSPRPALVLPSAHLELEKDLPDRGASLHAARSLIYKEAWQQAAKAGNYCKSGYNNAFRLWLQFPDGTSFFHTPGEDVIMLIAPGKSSDIGAISQRDIQISGRALGTIMATPCVPASALLDQSDAEGVKVQYKTGIPLPPPPPPAPPPDLYPAES